MATINISSYSKADVLRVLYDNSRPLGLGMLRFTPENMTTQQAEKAIQDSLGFSRTLYFDYLGGRVMKVDLTTDELDPRLYDRDNGDGAAQRAIAKLALSIPA